MLASKPAALISDVTACSSASPCCFSIVSAADCNHCHRQRNLHSYLQRLFFCGNVLKASHFLMKGNLTSKSNAVSVL